MKTDEIVLDTLVETENARLRRQIEKLEKLVVTDELTGVLNRRGIEQAIDAAAKRSARHPSYHFSVIMMDVDHFKQLNDQHGHAAGDFALQLIGCALREFTRANEAAGRWGGEEFVIVTENDLPGAARFANRLRKAIQSTVYVDVEGIPEYVTASFGVAEYLHTDYGSEWRAVVEDADRALYLAKASGRNCVKTLLR